MEIKDSETHETPEVFYPPSIYNINGDNLGLRLKERFINAAKITETELDVILKAIKVVSEEKDGKPLIISFSNFKGGCGKTTTSVTFAQFLTNLGIKTIVLDCDYMRIGYKYLQSRSKLISGYIQNMTNDNLPVEAIQKFKDDLDPICDSEVGEFATLLNSINQVVETGRYKIIIVDTPALKSELKNFSINNIGKPQMPHSLIGYISDAVVIPSKATSFDRTGSIDYYVQLETFVSEMMFKGIRKSLAFRILPTLMESNKEPFVLEFFKTLKDNGVEKFDSSFRDSAKFKNSVTDNTIDTFFTVNNAQQKTIEFKNFVVQVFEDILEAKRKDAFIESKKQATNQIQDGE